MEAPCENPEAITARRSIGQRASASTTTARRKATSSRAWVGEPPCDQLRISPFGATSRKCIRAAAARMEASPEISRPSIMKPWRNTSSLSFDRPSQSGGDTA